MKKVLIFAILFVFLGCAVDSSESEKIPEGAVRFSWGYGSPIQDKYGSWAVIKDRAAWKKAHPGIKVYYAGPPRPVIKELKPGECKIITIRSRP